MDIDAPALVVAAICVLILAAAFVLLFGAKSERDILARMQGAGARPGSRTRTRGRRRARTPCSTS